MRFGYAWPECAAVRPLSAELSRRVGKVVAHPPLCELPADQRREFHEGATRRRPPSSSSSKPTLHRPVADPGSGPSARPGANLTSAFLGILSGDRARSVTTYPHSLRRTFASLLYAIGEPAPIVMQELGHTHPALALRIYAHAMRRDEDEDDRLRGAGRGV
jgi:integrase